MFHLYRSLSAATPICGGLLRNLDVKHIPVVCAQTTRVRVTHVVEVLRVGISRAQASRMQATLAQVPRV